LLDDAAAQIRVRQPAFRAPNGFTQVIVGDALAVRKTCKPFRYEHLQLGAPIL
jgi:hypothetical protein